jgi:hypothetical protein
MLIAAASYAMSNILKFDPITYFVKNKNILLLVNLFVIFAVFNHFVNRDFYLPFLGPAVIPIQDKKLTGKIIDVTINNLPPNTRIVFWGANESDGVFQDPLSAYSGYSNSGVSISDQNGNATIQINCPSEYYVNKFGIRKKLDKHIHYRTESPKFPGLFSSVKTHYIQC